MGLFKSRIIANKIAIRLMHGEAEEPSVITQILSYTEEKIHNMGQ